MQSLKRAIGLVLESKVLTFTSLTFIVTGLVVGVLYFPPSWSLWVRISLGFTAGLMGTLYAVGNHVLMEMNDSINDVTREREQRAAQEDTSTAEEPKS